MQEYPTSLLPLTLRSWSMALATLVAETSTLRKPSSSRSPAVSQLAGINRTSELPPTVADRTCVCASTSTVLWTWYWEPWITSAFQTKPADESILDYKLLYATSSQEETCTRSSARFWWWLWVAGRREGRLISSTGFHLCSGAKACSSSL